MLPWVAFFISKILSVITSLVVDEAVFLRYARPLIDLISSRIRVMLSDIPQGETDVRPAPVAALKEHEPAA
jgi:hypothetical protein